MKIRVINANTSEVMTRGIEEAAREYARPDTEIQGVNPQAGPVTIEGYYDINLAIPGVLEEVRQAVKDSCDGIIIACYADPGLYAAREIASIPVVGIAEASMFMSCMLGHKFSVVTVLRRAETLIKEVVYRYGMADRCASVRGTGLSVMDFVQDRERGKKALMELGRRVIKEDDAEVICLGCTGMVGFDRELEKELGVPVIDPVVASVKMIEGIVEYGKRTGKGFTFKHPEKKLIKGYPEHMQA